MEENSETKLEKIIKIEKQLGEIQDVDVLLEKILTETRKIVNADAGSIYVIEGNKLKIKYGQNDTHLKELAPGEKLPYTCFSFPINENQICGYVASTKEPLKGYSFVLSATKKRPSRLGIRLRRRSEAEHEKRRISHC